MLQLVHIQQCVFVHVDLENINTDAVLSASKGIISGLT